MENVNKLESGFKINSIILSESSFSRINNVNFDGGVDNKFDTNIEVGVNNKVITVAEEVVLIQKFQNIEQFRFKVRMIGIFECVGETSLTNLKEFGRINGAAIIFPYIREHITNISLKAGIGAIILPPVNLTKVESED